MPQRLGDLLVREKVITQSQLEQATQLQRGTPLSLIPALEKLGAVRNGRDGIKILGTGELTRKITIEAHLFSESALKKIQAAGGEAKIIARPEKKAEK